MYEAAIDAAKKSLFFRPFTDGNPDILLTGSVFLSQGSKARFDSNTGHLVASLNHNWQYVLLNFDRVVSLVGCWRLVLEPSIAKKILD